jgi:hypothetical protein
VGAKFSIYNPILSTLIFLPTKNQGYPSIYFEKLQCSLVASINNGSSYPCLLNKSAAVTYGKPKTWAKSVC